MALLRERDINLIIVHCSDSDHLHHDNYESIRKWHVDENGWSDVGYHFLILKSGEVIRCRPLEKKGSHCKGFNKNSIGICLTGKNEFSDAQFKSLKKLTKKLKEEYELNEYDILGHRDFNKNKTCPNFEVLEKIRGL